MKKKAMLVKTSIFLAIVFIGTILISNMLIADAFPLSNGVIMPQNCDYEEISQMEHGWEDYYHTGRIFYDDYQKIDGNASLALQTDLKDGKNIVAAKHSFPSTSFESRAFRFFVRVSDWRQVELFSVLMNSNGNWHDMYAVDIKPLFNIPNNNEWLEVVLSRSDLYEVRNPMWSDIDSIMFRLISTPGTEPTVWIDSFGSFESIKEPLVSIVFDDGMAVTYENALPVFEEFGVRSTCFVIPDLIGHPEDGFMTQEQVDKLSRYYGWGIGGHDWTVLTDLPIESKDGDPAWTRTLDETLSRIRQYLDEHNYPGKDCFAIPYGKYNQRVIDNLCKYFTYIRPHNLLTQPTGYVCQNEINSHLVASTTNMEDIQYWIDNAKKNNDWVILVMHRIVDNPREGVYTESSTEFLRQIIDYSLNIAEVNVVPFHEALEQYYPEN
ncbi:MAG: polysaccharide deacetylase family protein [Caldisericia bacterium]|nr:polysaccharide deacetylase family protein [Caldisericia bacterium]